MHIRGLEFPTAVPAPHTLFVAREESYYDSLLDAYVTQRGARSVIASMACPVNFTFAVIMM